jgi:hypothetical protein
MNGGKKILEKTIMIEFIKNMQQQQDWIKFFILLEIDFSVR